MSVPDEGTRRVHSNLFTMSVPDEGTRRVHSNLFTMGVPDEGTRRVHSARYLPFSFLRFTNKLQ